MSGITFLMKKSDELIKDSDFVATSHVDAVMTRSLSFSVGVPRDLPKLHICFVIEPTLEFHIDLSYCDARDSHVLLGDLTAPHHRAVWTSIEKIKQFFEHKRLQLGQDVTIGDEDATTLLGNVKGILEFLSKLQACDGVLSDSKKLKDMLPPNMTAEAAVAQIAENFYVIKAGRRHDVHATGCLLALYKKKRCENCSKNAKRKLTNAMKRIQRQPAAGAGDVSAPVPALVLGDAVDRNKLANIAKNSNNASERLLALLVLDASSDEVGTVASSRRYATEVKDLASVVYRTVGVNAYAHLRDFFPFRLPANSIVREFNAARAGVRPPLTNVLEINSLKKQFELAATTLPLPAEVARQLVLGHCVMAFDGMVMRNCLVAQRGGRFNGTFAGTAVPNVAEQLIHVDGDEGATAQRVATSVIRQETRWRPSGVPQTFFQPPPTVHRRR
jgi:hypothetical protein